MRLLKIAIYILAALTTGELSYKVNAASSFQVSSEVEVNNFTTVDYTAAHKTRDLLTLPEIEAQTFTIVAPTNTLIEAIALPSAVNGQEFASLNRATSTQVLSFSAADLSNQLAQATTLSDIQGNWAQSFITALAARGIIQGFPDGTFRPDTPVTRAEFAAMIGKAFQKNPVREAISFVDVPPNYWATGAIQSAYQTGFLAGYPNNVFMPSQEISRVQVLVSLTNGLGLSAKAESAGVLDASFQDAAEIPDYARTPVAAATENRLVVNYPNVALLNPNQVATRADVAAFIYQALVSTGTVPQLTASDAVTQYIVGYQLPAAQPAASNQQELQALQKQFTLPEPRVVERPVPRALGLPGSSVGSPSAFGADWGDVFAGFSFQERTRFTDKADGAVVAGFGIGDAQKLVGLEVAVTVFDLIDDTFQDGGISFKLHHDFGDGFAVAAGVENAIIWGGLDTNSSAYGVVSKVFRFKDATQPFSSLTVNLGLGGGRFRSEDDVFDGDDSINVFGSAGLRVIEPISVIADWTGQDLNLGISLVPFRNIPLTITPAIADVTSNAGDGARFVLSIGYGLSLTPPTRSGL